MHWIQTIRENLLITQKELAIYLQLSVPTIKAVETGQRQLPQASLESAMVLFNAIKACQARGPARDAQPNKQQLRQLQRLNNKYQKRFEQATCKLEKMQKTNESACLSLDVYQQLVNTPDTTNGKKEDDARRRWAQLRIAEATLRIKENNTIAQSLAKAEIAGLKAMKQVLERILT